MKRLKSILILTMFSCLSSIMAADNFYKKPGLFSTRPDVKKSLQEIKRFGPVGLGFELIHPVFTLRVANVEEGSPAASTGKFKKGQIIESINGQKLADIDPRIQLGNVITKAEATDGLVKLKIKGGEEVTVKIPVMGTYSPTWPLNCAKSDKIVRHAADYLKSPKAHRTLGDIGMLLLLSTGDKDDLEFVRKWARKAPAHKYPWFLGYGGIPLTECYLRTGDKEILARIQEWVDSAVKAQHNDAWAGRGSALTTYGNGHLNASGTHVVTFLLLAKECGADVPDFAMMRALRHFYRYAGRGGNPYGDNRTEIGFVDNGKNGKLAFAMAAAASLTGKDENSVYAQARDICAMQSFYTTTFMLHGHTGGGIGEIWRSASMGFLHEKKAKQYRDFMDQRRWHYEMSRRYNGSFGILGGSGYDKEQWGMAYVLTYTMPKKTLRITGAPRTKYSKTFKLPEVPWGTKADNAFMSLKPALDKNGQAPDFSGETLEKDSSLHFLKWFHGSKQPTDDEIRRYAHHFDFNYRYIATNKALGVNSAYLGKRSGGGKLRKHLMMEFFTHKDPRVRHAMISAMVKQPNVVDEKIFEMLIENVKNPEESWGIKDQSMLLISRMKKEWILPHVDLFLPILKYDDWWLQNSALGVLSRVAVDKSCYQKVLPAIGDLVRNNQRIALTQGFMGNVRSELKKASPEIRQLGSKVIKESFTGYSGQKVSEGGQNIAPTYEHHLKAIANSLADTPGGYDALYEVAREKYPNDLLPYREIFLNADPKYFGEKLRAALIPIIQQELIPEYYGKSRKSLHQYAESKVQNSFMGQDPIDNLAALHKRAGTDEYDWRVFADLKSVEWFYHSFDPIASEQVPPDQMVTRYRPVTLPSGMDDWFKPDFKPSSVGWKKGKSPFGNYMGKIPNRPITKCGSNCLGPHCYGAIKVNTLWEKEVLLIHGKYKIPAVKDGHRYRIRINDGNHVGSGGGYKIYINGKELVEAKQGGGRGSGSKKKGGYITKDFQSEFNGEEVTIAVISFIRYNDKYKTKPKAKTPMGKISLHFEEQKIPPMSDDLLFQSAKVIPLMSSEWQSAKLGENKEVEPESLQYRWNGEFVANSKIMGKWKTISTVSDISAFDPSSKLSRPHRPFTGSINFLDNSKTSNKSWFWSGSYLMDLEKFQALKMQLKTINGKDYLFIENGGFSNRNKPGWKTTWTVMSR